MHTLLPRIYQGNISIFLNTHPDAPLLAGAINAIEAHTHIVDSLDALLATCGGCSEFWFYKKMFNELFIRAQKNPSQFRFLMAFGIVSDSFSSAASVFHPDERVEMGRDAVDLSLQMLKKIALLCVGITEAIVAEHFKMAELVLYIINNMYR